MKTIQKIRNLFSFFAATEPQMPPLKNSFFATVSDIKRDERNGTTGYLLLLNVHNVNHLVPAFLLNLEPFRNDSNIEFDKIKSGDVIRTLAIGGHIENFVPHSVLGRVEICPHGIDTNNVVPVKLGYTTYSSPLPELMVK